MLAKHVKTKTPGDATTIRMLELGVKAAQDHDKIVQTYGRYPHRNAVLGRKSTTEELEYLKSA